MLEFLAGLLFLEETGTVFVFGLKSEVVYLRTLLLTLVEGEDELLESISKSSLLRGLLSIEGQALTEVECPSL